MKNFRPDEEIENKEHYIMLKDPKSGYLDPAKEWDMFWAAWMALGVICLCVVNFLCSFFKDRT